MSTGISHNIDLTAQANNDSSNSLTRPIRFILLRVAGGSTLVLSRYDTDLTPKHMMIAAADPVAASMMQAPCGVVLKASVPIGEPMPNMRSRPQHMAIQLAAIGRICISIITGHRDASMAGLYKSELNIQMLLCQPLNCMHASVAFHCMIAYTYDESASKNHCTQDMRLRGCILQPANAPGLAQWSMHAQHYLLSAEPHSASLCRKLFAGRPVTSTHRYRQSHLHHQQISGFVMCQHNNDRQQLEAALFLAM